MNDTVTKELLKNVLKYSVGFCFNCNQSIQTAKRTFHILFISRPVTPSVPHHFQLNSGPNDQADRDLSDGFIYIHHYQVHPRSLASGPFVELPKCVVCLERLGEQNSDVKISIFINKSYYFCVQVKYENMFESCFLLKLIELLFC